MGFVVKLLRTTVIPDNGIIVQKVAACLIKNKTVQRKCQDFLLNGKYLLLPYLSPVIELSAFLSFGEDLKFKSTHESVL